ncbi:UDP-glucose dehydrogenase family protein [Gilliamella apis]|uniref:UDP-glucose dehydrogenase family protein n=1 Tax=Gilliamella apis TaxID=1970738 RepID=UPI000A35780F|nr:UDP-glucose/GDP-mannose dehydrogenase family protein [Gilliamella apis]OTQ58351.1 UDP-glucose 6-dehydrogenase [Gilliamella apis]OTQ62859.1 UDP-glucose 6-dehydrogenase [Gilliamella apis]OTQ66276.1 UDP-glucose 6-dehydrogenase [Gilliamella apis]OTQ66569.1 UDP-glucose 6-dehydrogenase [Gilliamella apis]
MKISIIGTGYVGLPTGVGMAELGHQVVCIDREISKIERLKKGEITLFEDGLEELLKKNLERGKISFTNSMKEGIADADIVLIAVGTPPHPVTKEADMKYVHAAATELAQHLDKYTVIATKSTVPVGTGDDIESLISKTNPNAKFDVVSLPEFLREGFAVHDFFNPDRIIIGTDSDSAKAVLTELYKPFVDKSEILFVKRRSSETIKYASNAFLALKIHYINEMADFCEKANADIEEVAKGMGLDSRIGNKFLNPGPGYGGSCFPKDTNAMHFMAKQNGVELTLIEAAIRGNEKRKKDIAQKIISKINHINSPKVAVLGLTFKGGTDDCRESPAMEIIDELLKHELDITAYDPKGMKNANELLGDKINYAEDIYSVANDADILVILTEWDDFKNCDLQKVIINMRNKNIFDTRNILNAELAEKLGFSYYKIGK